MGRNPVRKEVHRVRATTRRQFLLASLATGGTIALVACGSAQTSGRAASGLAPGRAGGAPRWGMTAGQESAWQQIEAAADKEGAVTYYGQGINTLSEVPLFTDAWKKVYPNIKIDLVNDTADVQTRISTEQTPRATLVTSATSASVPAYSKPSAATAKSSSRPRRSIQLSNGRPSVSTVMATSLATT
jgi:hypothetical protein